MARRDSFTGIKLLANPADDNAESGFGTYEACDCPGCFYQGRYVCTGIYAKAGE